jgi:hypothetical protein
MGTNIPYCTGSHFTKQLFLMIQTLGFIIQYRNYRKSSEAHCGQRNQKMATKTDIQCIFQLLHVPVSEMQRYIECTGIY